MRITALYAALLIPIFLVLSFRVIGARTAARIVVGDGGDTTLRRRMRVHANFAEYVPLALLLLLLAESLKTDVRLLHGIGVLLLVGRLSHAYGMSRDDEPLIFRQIGVVATFAVLVIAAATCLIRAI